MVGLEIKITTNAIELNNFLKIMADRQLPFVTAKTLTDLAIYSKKKQTELLPEYFTIRTRWTRSSLKSIRAEKRDWPDAFSILGVRDKILASGVTGEDRGKGAVPISNTREILNPSKKTLGPAFFPKAISKKKVKGYGNRPFLMETKSGKMVIAVRKSKARVPLDFLYILKDNIKMKAKSWPLVDNVRDDVARLYAPFFTKNLTRALAE